MKRPPITTIGLSNDKATQIPAVAINPQVTMSNRSPEFFTGAITKKPANSHRQSKPCRKPHGGERLICMGDIFTYSLYSSRPWHLHPACCKRRLRLYLPWRHWGLERQVLPWIYLLRLVVNEIISGHEDSD